jgi:hypothetical protein
MPHPSIVDNQCPVTEGDNSKKVFIGSQRSIQSPGQVHIHDTAPQISDIEIYSEQLNPPRALSGHSNLENSENRERSRNATQSFQFSAVISAASNQALTHANHYA